MKFSTKKSKCLIQPLNSLACGYMTLIHDWETLYKIWGLKHKAAYCLPSVIAFMSTLLLSLNFACVCIKHNLQHLLSVDEKHIHLIHIEKILFTAWSTWNSLSDRCTTIEWQTCAGQISGNCHVYKWEQCPSKWKMLLAVSDSFSNRHLTPNSHSWLVSRWFHLSLSKQLFSTDTELMAYWHTAISKHDTLHPSKYFFEICRQLRGQICTFRVIIMIIMVWSA